MNIRSLSMTGLVIFKFDEAMVEVEGFKEFDQAKMESIFEVEVYPGIDQDPSLIGIS